jgi:hypothetical protein
VGPAAPLAPGLEAVFRYVVTRADTAAAVGSGEVPVLVLERVEGRRLGPPPSSGTPAAGPPPDGR